VPCGGSRKYTCALGTVLHVGQSLLIRRVGSKMRAWLYRHASSACSLAGTILRDVTYLVKRIAGQGSPLSTESRDMTEQIPPLASVDGFCLPARLL
jgi:hypothetical protein